MYYDTFDITIVSERVQALNVQNQAWMIGIGNLKRYNMQLKRGNKVLIGATFLRLMHANVPWLCTEPMANQQ